jgi:hypothetical protein
MNETQVAPKAPTNPASTMDAAGLLRLTYDASGLQTVALSLGPLVGWVFDPAKPLTPGTLPVGIGDMPAAPPDTTPIISPRWAVIYEPAIVYTEGEVWCGPFADFLLWIATNNGAQRTLSAAMGMPALTNIWNEFARAFSQYVTPNEVDP